MTTAPAAAWRIISAPFRRRCTHPDLHCVHGDAIIAAGQWRAHCRTCGRRPRHLPEPCTLTGRPHPGTLS